MKAWAISTLLCMMFVPQWLSAQEVNVNEFLAKGESYRRQKMYIESIEEFDKAIRLSPGNPKALFYKGMSMMSLKDFDGAVEAFDQILKGRQDFVPAYMMAAKSYENMGRYVKVVEYLRKAYQYEKQPKVQAAIKKEIIKTLVEHDNPDEALAEIAEINQKGYGDPEVLYYEANIYNQKGMHGQAKNAMEAAVSQINVNDPRISAKFFYELGLAYSRLGDYEKSSEALRRANFGPFKPLVAKLSPQYYTNAASVLLGIPDVPGAKTLIDMALKIHPGNSLAHSLMANVSRKETQGIQAVQIFKKAIENATEHAKQAAIYRDMAKAQMESEQFKSAIETLNMLLVLEKNDYQALMMRAVSLYRSQQFAFAIDELSSLASLQGFDRERKAQYFYYLGLCHRDTKQLETAWDNFEQAATGEFKPLADMELDKIKLPGKSRASSG